MLVQIKKDTALLNDFIDEIERYIKTAESERHLVENITYSLTELLARRYLEWLPQKYLRPVSGAYSQYPLYVAPDGTFCVTAVAFNPGVITDIHDHRVWGVVGVYQGVEDQMLYKRTGPGGIRPAGRIISQAGDCSYLLPPEEEIHTVANPTGDCSVSIHIYGADIVRVPRRNYNLETGEVTTVYSRYAS
jgi:predicted metal-dependent enzyme (double-stranded beta helix superfamily)